MQKSVASKWSPYLDPPPPNLPPALPPGTLEEHLLDPVTILFGNRLLSFACWLNSHHVLSSSSLCPSAFWINTTPVTVPQPALSFPAPVFAYSVPPASSHPVECSFWSLDDPSGPLPSKTSLFCQLRSRVFIVGLSTQGGRHLPACLFCRNRRVGSRDYFVRLYSQHLA